MRDRKLNIIMGISGNDEGDRWYDLWEEGGTTNERFIDFIQRILNDIGPGTPERRYCFTMDNLSAHTNPTILGMIIDAGHRILFRAPYYPVDGPIEYVFNTIQNMLCIFMHEVNDMETLRIKIENIIGSLGTFRNYFIHCGFDYNQE